MFNASYFTYDGVFSGLYGLTIASFDDEHVTETLAFSPTLNTFKPVWSNKFYHNGVVYEQAPSFQFSILSEDVISDRQRRNILAWLVGRNAYKQLIIHQPDFELYTYNCVFTETNIIYVNGQCHGFKITANFDSWYTRGMPTKVSKSFAFDGTLYLQNNSDVVDSYVYPVVKFQGDISITNKTDNENRTFIFENVSPNELITVDNEIRSIKSDTVGTKLSKFNKNWLRLKNGKNELEVTSNGAFEIICPCYAMIGF